MLFYAVDNEHMEACKVGLVRLLGGDGGLGRPLWMGLTFLFGE